MNKFKAWYYNEFKGKVLTPALAVSWVGCVIILLAYGVGAAVLSLVVGVAVLYAEEIFLLVKKEK